MPLLMLLLGAPILRTAVPEPIARWTFDGDARDSVGTLHGELLGDATITDGRLVLKGNGHVRTAPLTRDLAAKTLVARVKVDPLGQGAGGVMTVATIDGWMFDSIVHGEISVGEWNAGSPGFIRTQRLADAFPEEASAGFVQMAITYADDGTISVYRNGLRYGLPYRKTDQPWLFESGAGEVFFGTFHTDRADSHLRGEIKDAALYDRALTADEVAELAGVLPASAPNLLVNGGFESGSLSPWEETVQPNLPGQRSSVFAESVAQGSFSLAPGLLHLSQRVPTEPGREYVLAFAYAGRGSYGAFRVRINGVDRGAEIVDGSVPLPLSAFRRTGTWAYASRRFTASATTSEVTFDFSREPYLNVLLDDIRVYPAEIQEAEMMVEWVGQHVTVREGEGVTATVRRSGPLDRRGFATVELRPGTARVSGDLPDLDLSIAPQSFGSRVGLTFLPGQAEVSVTLRGRADSELEPSETASLHLLPTGNASVQGNPLAVTVEAAPTRILASGGAYEQDGGGGQIVLGVDSGSGGRVRVQTTSEGTAWPGVDFLAIDQEFDVIPGRAAIIPIQVLRDNLIEGDETIGVRVTPLSDQTEVAPTVLFVPLADDLYVEPVADSGQVSEAVGAVRFSLVRRGSLDSPQVFHVRYRLEGRKGLRDGEGRMTSAAQPGLDFQSQEGVVEFGPGVSRRTLEVLLLNNTDADGPHGLALRLEGSPEFPTLRAQGEAFVVIADDEHDALRQNTQLMSSLEDAGDYAFVSPSPGGGSLVIQGRQITRLTPTGVPDLSFGGGDGHMLVPLLESQRILPPSAVQLADGGVLVLADASDDDGSKTAILRLTADGSPDPLFGNVSGRVVLAGQVEQMLPIQAGGFLSVVRDSPRDIFPRVFLQRLDSNGTPEAQLELEEILPPDKDHVSLIPAPDGSVWVLAKELVFPGQVGIHPVLGALGRLLPDGRPDSAFGLRDGVSGLFGFDTAGRAYVGLDGELVRFLPDGSNDTSYRPAVEQSGDSLFCQVFPDGSTVLTQSGNLILELAPDGRLDNRFDLTSRLDQIFQPLRWPFDFQRVASAIRQSDGTFVIETEECFFDAHADWLPWACYRFRYFLTRDGNLRPIFLPENLTVRTDGDFPILMGGGSQGVWRFAVPSADRQVGFPATGFLCQETSVRIPVQRTGSTAQEAEVRGRLLPWDGGRWDETLAIPFVVRFGVGAADASVEMSLPGRAGKPSVRDYLVRLESASGMVLGPFNECRLWVLDEGLMPQPGGLKIVSPASPNPSEAIWLLVQPFSAATPGVESNGSLQEQAWLSHRFDFPGWIPSGSLMVSPTYTDSSSARFFRMTY